MFIRKKIRIISLCFLVLLSACTKEVSFNNISEYSPIITEEKKSSEDIYHTFTTNYYSNVVIHNEPQRLYLNNELENINYFGWGNIEVSRPAPFNLRWKYETNDESVLEYFDLHVSLNEDMNDFVSYQTNDNFYQLNNLFINTTYFYTVTAVYEHARYESPINRFVTENSIIRPVYVSGVTNARDLGGYINANNKRINQGLIYRMGQLNLSYADELTPLITEKGKKTLLEDFGIKTEIDLRMTDNNEVGHLTSSLLGEDVNYFINTLEWDVDNAIINEQEAIKDTFKVFGNKNNYPILFHCAIGTDRTGLIAFLLLSLLGVSEEDIARDYLFSNFGNIGGTRNLKSINAHRGHISRYPGNNMQEKTYNYLLSIGVSEEEINTILSIMID